MPQQTEDSDPQSTRLIERQLQVDGFQWQLYECGQGPDILLLHGTGSSAHTWRALLPELSGSCRLLMPDLPGHGRSKAPRGRRLTIENISDALGGLLRAADVSAVFAIGHSAGAALLAQMALDEVFHPRAIVSLNGAFMPFQGAANPVFGSLARLLSAAPLVPQLVSRRLANRRAVERLISQVGSSPSQLQVDEYVSLLQSPGHIGAALGMMANWDLAGLSRRLPGLAVPLELVACEGDRAVPAVQAQMLADRVPRARVHRLSGLGHLGHEEQPSRIAPLLRTLAEEVSVAL